MNREDCHTPQGLDLPTAALSPTEHQAGLAVCSLGLTSVISTGFSENRVIMTGALWVSRAGPSWKRAEVSFLTSRWYLPAEGTHTLSSSLLWYPDHLLSYPHPCLPSLSAVMMPWGQKSEPRTCQKRHQAPAGSQDLRVTKATATEDKALPSGTVSISLCYFILLTFNIFYYTKSDLIIFFIYLL